MFYQLSRLGLAEIKKKNYSSQYGGSSSLKAWGNNISVKDKKQKKTLQDTTEETLSEETPKEKEKKAYKIRKSKIRNKIMNFFSLDASKNFCAFYSISFPINIADDIAYKLLNTWLTRCRKVYNLKSYIWVAERQKNNTLHFHLLTNTRMPIKEVNGFMKSALITQYKKGLLSTNIKTLEKYNGVDVDNLHYPKKRKNGKKKLSFNEAQSKLSMYLTKYVTKNDTISERLPWHCSRDISALFVSINYSDISTHEIAQLVSDNPEAVLSYYDEYFTFHYFLFRPSEFYFEDLKKINNEVYRRFNPN